MKNAPTGFQKSNVRRSASSILRRVALAFISALLAVSLLPAVALGQSDVTPFAADPASAQSADPASSAADSVISPAAYAPVNTIFTGTISVGGGQVPCTYEVTGAGTVQVGDGANPAIDTSLSGALVIPASVAYGGDSYAVTSLGDFAFPYCTSLTSTGLASNSTVASLGNGVFSDCTSLTSTGLESNSTVTSLGQTAFRDCKSLTSTGLASNSTVTSLGQSAFQNCTSLTSTGLESNSTVTSIGYAAFSRCTSLTSTGLASNSTVILIPRLAFGDCTSLTSTGLGSNSTVTSIGQYAFSDCTSLTSTGLESNSTVTSLGKFAFYNCASLSGDLVLGPNVSSVEYNAFGNTGYTAVYLLAPSPSSISIGGAFAFSVGTTPPLHVPASWAGTDSFTATNGYTYKTADGSLIIDAAPSLSSVSVSRTSAQSASVSFTSSVSGSATVLDASGAALWSGSASANTPATASFSGVGPASATLTVKVRSGASIASSSVLLPASSCTLSFDGNGADAGSMDPQRVSYGSSVQLAANAYRRSGCSFAGWNTAPDGSGAAYADGQAVSGLSGSGSVVLYAQWVSAPPSASVAGGQPSLLPSTGDSVSPVTALSAMLVLAALAALVGATVLLLARRRRSGHSCSQGNYIADDRGVRR